MQFLFLGFLLCLVNAQTTLRCWNLRGSTLEQKDCPASPTNGPPYCTHYDFQGDLIVACSNQDVCVKLANLGYSNFVCCNTTLCNYPDNFTPPANNTPTPEPDPANLGPDGVLQCYDYNDDVSKENRTVVNCPDLQNSKARCVRYTRVYDVPDPEEARTVISQCSHEIQCSDFSKQPWVTNLKCCNDDLCNDPFSSGGLPGWAIAIIVIAVIAAVVILAAVVFFFIIKPNKAERV